MCDHKARKESDSGGPPLHAKRNTRRRHIGQNSLPFVSVDVLGWKNRHILARTKDSRMCMSFGIFHVNEVFPT